MRKPLNEKYRPTTLDDYVFQNDTIRRAMTKYVENGQIENMIMCGAPGTGKSSLSRIIQNEFEYDPVDVKVVDASQELGLPYIRDVLIPWLNLSSMSGKKLVVMEEFNRLREDTQKALLSAVEESTARGVRFFLTTNYIDKIIPAMQSRFDVYHISEMPMEDFIVYAAEIIEKENIEATEDDFMTHVDVHYPDMRKMINSISMFTDKDNVLHPYDRSSDPSGSVDEWDQLWGSEELPSLGECLELSALIDSNNFDQFYEAIYRNSSKFEEEQGNAIIVVSEYLFKAQTSANQRLHLDACLYTIFGGE